MDTRKRSWVKSVTWRIVGIGILGGITYGLTKDLNQTTVITLLFHTVRFALYYYHERVWDRINWGRTGHPLADIQIRPGLNAADRERICKFLEAHGYAARRNKDEFSGVAGTRLKRDSAFVG